MHTVQGHCYRAPLHSLCTASDERVLDIMVWWVGAIGPGAGDTRGSAGTRRRTNRVSGQRAKVGTDMEEKRAYALLTDNRTLLT